MPTVKTDLRIYKNNLREKYKKIRKNLSCEKKSVFDNKIFERIISLRYYKECNTVLTYVSNSIEVDTHRLIEYSLSCGKLVAVPKCVAGTREMEFYLIKSFNDLEVATFSVLEPKVNQCEKLTQFSQSVCIVPGLAFDIRGYRLGYGKGYYDRFLNKYDLPKFGICYTLCTQTKLINGKYDKPVDLLITDKYTHKTEFKGDF